MLLKDAEIKALLGITEAWKQCCIQQYLVYYMSYEQLCEYAFDVVDMNFIVTVANKYLIPLPWHVLLTNGYKISVKEDVIWGCCVVKLEDYRCLEQVFPRCKDSILMPSGVFAKLYPYAEPRIVYGVFKWVSKEVYDTFIRSGYNAGMMYYVNYHEGFNVDMALRKTVDTKRLIKYLKEFLREDTKISPLRIYWCELSKFPLKYRDTLFTDYYNKTKDYPDVVEFVEFYRIFR